MLDFYGSCPKEANGYGRKQCFRVGLQFFAHQAPPPTATRRKVCHFSWAAEIIRA